VSQLKTLESTTTKLTDLKEANEFDIIDGKVKMETMRKQMQLLSDENVRVVNELEQSQVIQANAEKVAKEFEALYNDMKNQFDIVSKERHELRQKAESLDIEIKDQQENLIELRKNDATLSEKLLAVETSNAKLNAAYIKTKGKLDELEEEVSQGRKGIQEINDGRHATLEALEQRTFELKETTQNLEDARDQISALESTLRTRDFDIKDL
jgi:chromosome segregation ATPase